MRYYKKLKFLKEIADATGVSINTALGRMRYAILNLRTYRRRETDDSYNGLKEREGVVY